MVHILSPQDCTQMLPYHGGLFLLPDLNYHQQSQDISHKNWEGFFASLESATALTVKYCAQFSQDNSGLEPGIATR